MSRPILDTYRVVGDEQEPQEPTPRQLFRQHPGWCSWILVAGLIVFFAVLCVISTWTATW